MIKSVGLVSMLASLVIVPCQQLWRVGSNEASNSQTIEDWVGQNYTTIVNKLLPSGYPYEAGVPGDVRWSMAVRILPAFDKPECRLSLTAKYDGTAVASMIATTGGVSIKEQMRSLRSEGADIDEVLKKISLKTVTVDSREDPRLVSIVRDYESLRFAPAMPDYLINDATRYEFWSESLWGAQMQVTLFGAPFGRERQPHPLLTWTERFRRVLEAHILRGSAPLRH